jgi:SAM-dependent methyltransferase
VLRDSHYRAKLVHRGRGLQDLERTVGGVVAEIETRLSRSDVVRVLEIGCGYGTALLELRERYGERVELHGQNRLVDDGNPDILMRNARERGLFGGSPKPRDLPSIAYGDVARGLPFADGHFDVVYSQVAWLYFANKIGVVRDVMRVLREGGVARIDADELREGLPAEYARLVEIWENGEIVPFGDYARRHGVALADAPEGHFLHFAKAPSFGRDLDPVVEIDLTAIHPDWDGIKCVYRVTSSPSRPPAATPVQGTDRGT